jgi:Zn-dependent M28 family amino/carboxypeptidase
VTACAGPDSRGPRPGPAAAPAFPGHRETQAAIVASDLASRTEALSDDRFEGRGPGTPRGEAAADWIAEEMQRLGLEPGAGGSYFQEVPAVSIALDPSRSRFEITSPDGTRALRYAEEVVFWTPRFDAELQSVEGAELVFVGYGVTAPDYGWDDFAGVDVRGKAIVVLVNDPGFVVGDDSLFKGRAMTYYGRWTYKLEEAARRGAAAVVLVHETLPAAYGWQVVRNSNTGAKYQLDVPDGNAQLPAVHSWVTTEVAQDLFARAGLDYDALRLAANRRGFRAVPMKGLRLGAVTQSSVERLKTRNVIGRIPGAERPDEVVLYNAHWDHLGVKESAPGPDKIHNGAVDNATGVAAILEIAEAFAKAPVRPRRSLLFTSVTLEEQGLLGSEYLAAHPPVPPAQIVAAINFDSLRPQGPARDMTVVGSGASELEDVLARVLATHDRVPAPDPEPEKGSFYRSDHVNLAKVGVPTLYAGGGTDLREGGKVAGQAARDAYRTAHYHQPSDEFDPAWDLRGPVEDVEVSYEVGLEVSRSDQWPNWYRGNEFRAIRDASRVQDGSLPAR